MSGSRKEVFAMTPPIELRFRVDKVHRTKPVEAKRNSTLDNIISFCTGKKNASVEVYKQDEEPPLQIKYLLKAYNDCVVVGNEWRLDVLSLSIGEYFAIETRVLGRIICSFEMKFVTTEKKKGKIIVAGDRIVSVYVVDLKKDSVFQDSTGIFDKDILAIRPYNYTTLMLFHTGTVQIVSIEIGKMIKKYMISLHLPNPGLRLLQVPYVVYRFVNTFWIDYAELAIKDQRLFTLYKCQIVQEGLEFKVSEFQAVNHLYMKHLNTVQIHNYDRYTYLLNLTTQILVMKRHYPIDCGELKYRSQNSRLIYMENHNLLHICYSRVEAHTLEVLTNTISIKSFDCINLIWPYNSKFITAINLYSDMFILFFSNANNKNKKYTKYWATGTLKTNIKAKLRYLMSRTTDANEIQDVAEKMGMTRRDIFLELWLQSSKRTRADFDVLLCTEDYRTIIWQIKSALKKYCISFRELYRIERVCLKMLETQMSENPQELTIRNYLKSHFYLRKYEVELNIQRKKIRQSQLNSYTYNKFIIGIQYYQDIRNRNIKTHIVDLMKRRDSHGILNNYITGFKFVLRAIFPYFLREVITELKEDLYPLLQAYPQLLPKQNSKGEYNEASGIWANITSSEWDKNIYFEKIQTIDNVAVLEDMIKKDWFRWDWLVKHDLMKLKRHEFEKKFREDRDIGIYYIFFDLLFNILKNQDSLQKIVEYVEETYTTPEHLMGKVFLYWELHKFFQRPDILPGYNLKFSYFLPLKEDDIYRLVFQNEKNTKRLILTDIKDIYTSITNKNIFDESILTYFKADYSTLADLKYILNRVNNQKIYFHESNQNLYKVLVEAVFYKLCWEGSNMIPIKDILVYFESIPLYDTEIEKLQIIYRLYKHSEILSKIDLHMNLKKFFDNGRYVLRRLAYFYLEEYMPADAPLRLTLVGDYYCISFMDIMDTLLKIRDDLFKESVSDHTVLEVVLSLTMSYEYLIPDIYKMLNEGLLARFEIADPQTFIYTIIDEKVSKAYEVKPEFHQHEPFINSLLKLLPETSKKRIELQAHLDLGLLLSNLANPPKAPLTISSRFIEKQIEHQKISLIKQLDVQRIHELMCAMGCNYTVANLYYVLILRYLEEGYWYWAIKYIRLWNELNQNSSVVFSALITYKISYELSKELKSNLIEIIILMFDKPEELLAITEYIINLDESKKRKQYIITIVMENELNMEKYLTTNPIISEHLQKLTEDVCKMKIRDFFEEIRRSDIELQKKYVYYLYYRMLICNPIRAFELHSKYYEWIDIKRIEWIFLEMSSNQMFNAIEAILFFYKSLILLYSSNYLGVYFTDIEGFFKMPFDLVYNNYKDLLADLAKEMSNINYKEKHYILKYFKRLYAKKAECVNDNDYSMEVYSEGESERLSYFKKTADKNKLFSRLITKKTINPVRIIEPTTPLPVGEQDDRVDIWDKAFKSSIRPRIISTNVTSSLRYKPKSRESSGIKKRRSSKEYGLYVKHNSSIDVQDEPQSARKKRNYYDALSQPSSQILYQTSYQNPSQYLRQTTRTFNKVRSISRNNSPEKYRSSNIFNSNTNAHPEATTVYYQVESPKKTINIRPVDDIPLSESRNIEKQDPLNYERRPLSRSRELEQIASTEEVAQPKPSSSRVSNNSTIKMPEDIVISKTVSENFIESYEFVPKREDAMPYKYEPVNPPESQQEAILLASAKIYEVEAPTQRYMKPEKSISKFEQDIEQSNEPSKNEDYSKMSSDAKKRIISLTQKTPGREPYAQPRVIARTVIQQSPSQPASRYITPQASPETQSRNYSRNQSAAQSRVYTSQYPYPLKDEITTKIRYILDDIISKEDFSKLQQYLPQQKGNELPFLQMITRLLFKYAPFYTFVKVMETLRTSHIKFQVAVRTRNLEVMKNAVKAKLNFDLRSIFTPEMLYIVGPSSDLKAQNKAIFYFLEPTIKELVNDTNMFAISKLMSLSFNFNKQFEFLVQYQYLEKLFSEYLATRSEEEGKMSLEKIYALLSRLPIDMTCQRFSAMMLPLKYFKPQMLSMLLNLFSDLLEKKKDTPDGTKFKTYIEQCEVELSNLREYIAAK